MEYLVCGFHRSQAAMFIFFLFTETIRSGANPIDDCFDTGNPTCFNFMQNVKAVSSITLIKSPKNIKHTNTHSKYEKDTA